MAATKKPKSKKPRQSAEEKARIEAERIAMASAPDPQSGGAQIAGPKPSAKAVIKARQEAVADQFAAADAKGDPAVAEATLSRQIRGW